MKEIVDKILKEEEEARKIIEKTKAEAESLIFNAKKNAKEMIDSDLLESKKTALTRQKQAEEEFLREKQQILKNTKEESVNLRNKKEKEIPALAKKIFAKLTDIKA